MNNKFSILVLSMSLLILSGCDQYYRYPCQDPSNWEQDFCKKPLCEVNRDCPEYIFEPDDSAVRPVESSPNVGVCK